PSLWLSEGFTDYYSALSAFRAGVATEAQLLQWLAGQIGVRESNDERNSVSPSDASLATWRRYLGEPVSYYNAGAVLGALLDLSILRDTRGERGLDDVMTALFRDFYVRNQGFSPADLPKVVNAIAGRDYTDFFRRYIAGTEIPPYDAILASAGLRGNSRSITLAALGAQFERVPQGRQAVAVFPKSAAAKAGLRKGDVV